MKRSEAGRVVIVAAALAVVVGLLLGAVWLWQRALMYFPDRSPAPEAADVLAGAQDVVLHTSDGLELGGWYLPAPETCTSTVLLAQGNGGSRAGRVDLGRELHEAGFGVLLFDYRGFGGNEGKPSETGLGLDVRAARDFLLDSGVPPGSLIYLGESLGTGVISELATEHPPAAMVLRSPFRSFASVARAAYGVPLGWLLRDHYRVAEHVEQVDVPIAVVYGNADTIVPPADSRDVARTARQAGAEVVEVEVPDTGHNDPVLSSGPALLDALVEVAERGGAGPCD